MTIVDSLSVYQPELLISTTTFGTSGAPLFKGLLFKSSFNSSP